MSSSDLLLQMMEEEMAAEEQKPKSGLDEAIKEVEGVPVDEASKWMEKNISYVWI